jgi:ketosteroid isomerase-like protein
MSVANVETVRKAIAASARRDVETAEDLFTPDADLRPPSHRFDGVTFRGHNGLRAWIDRTRETSREMNATVDEVAASGEKVVMASELHVTGHESGVPIAQREFFVFTVHGGRIAAVIAYPTEREALQAAGLRYAP